MDNRNSILLLEPSFDPAIAVQCSLLIKVGRDCFSYAIIHNSDEKVYAVYDEQECANAVESFAKRLKSDSYLHLNYQNVKVAMHPHNKVDVPGELYSETNESIYKPYLIGPGVQSIFKQKPENFDFVTLFSINDELTAILDEHFTEAQRFPEVAGLLKASTRMQNTSMILDFTVESFYLVFMEDQKIIFQQAFESSGVEEFNYYILLVINQLNIQSAQTSVFLSGIINEGDDRYNCLLKYFSELQFLEVTEELDQLAISDMPRHYYTSLLSLSKCG